MNIVSSVKVFMASNAGRATSFSIVTLIGTAAVALLFFQARVLQKAQDLQNSRFMATPKLRSFLLAHQTHCLQA